MSSRTYTTHAQIRAQQRCIPSQIVEWLQAYGSEEHDHHGAIILFFDHAARQRLAREVGQQIVNHLGHFLNTYAVLSSDGLIITIGHRQKRIKHR